MAVGVVPLQVTLGVGREVAFVALELLLVDGAVFDLQMHLQVVDVVGDEVAMAAAQLFGSVTHLEVRLQGLHS